MRRPSRSMRGMSRVDAGANHVAMQKGGQLAQLDVAHSFSLDLGKELAEGEAAVVKALQSLGEDDGVDRDEPQIAEKERFGADVSGVFLAVEFSKQVAQILHDLLLGVGAHVLSLSQKLMATTRSSSRTVWAIIRSALHSGKIPARVGPSATLTTPVSRSASRTATALDPSTNPRPSAFATASFAHQKRASHSSRSGPRRSRSRRSSSSKATRSNPASRGRMRSTSIPAWGAPAARPAATSSVWASEMVGNGSRPSGPRGRA